MSAIVVDQILQRAAEDEGELSQLVNPGVLAALDALDGRSGDPAELGESGLAETRG